MRPWDLLGKYKDWLAALLFIAILTVYAIWYFQRAPQNIFPFVLTISIVAILVTILASQRKFRDWLTRSVFRFHTKQQEKGGWFYRYSNVALFLIFLGIMTLTFIGQSQLVPSNYVPIIVLTLFVMILASGVVLTIGFLRGAGWWGLLLIAILTAIAVLRFLIWRWLR